MNKSELLFYDAYEQFYAMTSESIAFKEFCKDAFGADFSQDGFSDLSQVDLILPYIPLKEKVHILDVGCGNGKMLGYLQAKTGATIHGFDYSEQAIQTARKLHVLNADFQVGVMGEMEYPQESFDVITSMDTMYFAKDMVTFVGQIKKWLKPEGVFFVGYQEGDVMPRTKDEHTSALAKAFRQNEFEYEVKDITFQTYEMLKRKRKAALKHASAFEAEGNKQWFDMLMLQTECATEDYKEFEKKLARYIYVAKKTTTT